MKVRGFEILLIFLIPVMCPAQEISPNVIEEQEFLTENKAKKGVKVLGSGLQYRITAKGKGRKPAVGDDVYVKYTGRFIDGTIFDQSVHQPAVFKMNGIIPGMAEGLTLIGTGGKITLYIPSKLAYGHDGAGPIPPDKMLVFEIELVEIYNETTD